jgi:cardiolipin synthase C
MKMGRGIAGFRLGWLAGSMVLLLGACASLPTDVARTPSYALTDTAETRLGRAVEPLARQHEASLSGLVPLPDGHEGFAARVLLAQAAERTLDIQTFIWHDDATGTLLFDQIRRAARRGVRVRLLLDDLNTQGLDPLLAMLAAEPNIELRLFNPFASRDHRLLGFLGDFERLNRRMHNKSFTADNQVSVVGGRNIGDEYFEADQDGNFIDNEVIAVGQAPRGVSALFDRYWNSVSAYPAQAILKGVTPMSAQAFDEKVAAVRSSAMAEPYLQAILRSPIVKQMLARELPWEWTAARLVFDDPEKVLLPPGATETQLLPRLLDAMGKPERELDLVSPYFVPDEKTMAKLTGLAQRGVRVRVLTNSLAATDVVPVYAGYAKFREPLLRSGVRLYELKATADVSRYKEDREAKVGSGVSARSNSALHAKNIAVDRERAFVGSFNLDPRSEHLNTEMGLVVWSPALAGAISGRLDERLPLVAYELKLADDGELQWFAADEPPQTVEPDTSFGRRLKFRLLRMLPSFDWLL